MTETERKTAEQIVAEAFTKAREPEYGITEPEDQEDAEIAVAALAEAGLLVGEPSEEQIDAAGLAIARVLFPRWDDAARRDHARDKNSLIRVAACNALAAAGVLVGQN